MRVTVEIDETAGRLIVLAEHRVGLALDQAAVADAVTAALTAAAAATEPGPREDVAAQAPMPALEERDADLAAGAPTAGRSCEALRAEAVRLLDVEGRTDEQVCAALGVSRAQLLRWDNTPAELAAAGGRR